MTRSIPAAILGVCLVLPGAAFAQATRNATIQPDKPARLAVVTGFKKDCSLGEVGNLRVVSAPKNGSIVIRSGKAKTPAAFRCPNTETPIQALFYQSNKGFQGTDELTYESRDTDGATQTVTIKLTVTSKPPAPSGSGGGGGILDL